MLPCPGYGRVTGRGISNPMHRDSKTKREILDEDKQKDIERLEDKQQGQRERFYLVLIEHHDRVVGRVTAHRLDQLTRVQVDLECCCCLYQ